MPNCPICLLSNAVSAMSVPDIDSIRCSRCGEFELSRTLATILQRAPLTPRQLANASGWVRANQRVRLTHQDEHTLRTLTTPTISDKTNRLMLYIARTFPDPGTSFGVHLGHTHFGILWAKDVQECQYVAEYCIRDLELLRGAVTPAGPGPYLNAQVTPKGWEHIADISRRGPRSSFGFVAMRFAPESTPLRENGMKPAIIRAGYDHRLIDEVHHLNHIDDEILAAIRRSEFVVADLTGQRPNVYYEAGFAQGLGKPVIWTCHSAETEANRNHFDVRQYSFIEWDPGTLDAFSSKLTSRIVALLGPGPLIR